MVKCGLKISRELVPALLLVDTGPLRAVEEAHVLLEVAVGQADPVAAVAAEVDKKIFIHKKGLVNQAFL